MLTWLLTILLLLTGFLLIFIVLLQRGRGGGLAGALGGAGGQSAFGTRAGDVFTKITAGLAVVWVILAGVTGLAMRRDARGQFEGGKALNEKTQISAGDGQKSPEKTEEKTEEKSPEKTPEKTPEKSQDKTQ